MNDLLDIADAFWQSRSARAQDLIVLAAWLAPTLAALALATLRRRAWPVVRALLSRHRGVAATVVALVAVSVAVGVGIRIQERAVRQASARAAERFDLVVAAPGSDITAMLAAVYLQSANMPLLAATTYTRLALHPNVALAAPIAFGDSVDGAPVVGTDAAFVEYLAGAPAEGRAFADATEAVVGASSGFAVGDALVPAHGTGAAADDDAHAGTTFTVVGRMARTGTPWDRAVVVPVESVWIVHGLGDGHRADERGRIGPPWDPTRMPGVPAVVVRARSLGASYALRAAFTGRDSMAFFPGEVLTRLHGVLGDVRRVLSGMALATQGLVAVAVLTALTVLLSGFSRRFAMLRALGAPRGFVFTVAWLYATVLVAAGAVLGVALGQGVAFVLARLLARASSIDVRALPGIADLAPVAAFVLGGAALAAALAWRISGRPAIADLRA